MVFQAFIDDSRKADVFVLAGYIAPADKWAAFSNDWRELLEMKPRLDSFKMVEMSGSPERIERSSWFYRAIERHVTAAVSCVVDVPGLVSAVRKFQWPQFVKNPHELANPYYSAFYGITNILAQHQVKMGIDQPIDFIFDEQEAEKKETISGWELMRRTAEDNVLPLMGDAPQYRDDEKVLPLQAADLYAGWVRKWETEGILDGVAKLKFPWKAERDFPRLHIRLGEADFARQFAQAYARVTRRKLIAPPPYDAWLRVRFDYKV